MDLMQHITELRKRLLIALVAMVIMVVAALYFGTGLIDVLATTHRRGGQAGLH